ncbi:unnamed protein product [Rotaria magnacalcarata]|uniref:Uncharacterized protein n=2 Tax=Rotaria magnacalcarata TaxID=392030 RepID=A0A816ZUR1_9BILA|nr:unnamed protein product [Rotaria magnacalcarata]CAF1570138.1 unnamed protein product [Rotaria magnacalcarata]CAF2236391.1 unnamed protein product [Rotaria magnacalcarata]CAF3837207.1 unnamed protein product [Rotaria magnacalcarata]CAF3865247.1 unnamed protein product [Rotaria magnacalcarata]
MSCHPDSECDSNESDDDYFHSPMEEQKKNKQTLNSVFEPLGVSLITDVGTLRFFDEKLMMHKNMLKLCCSTTCEEENSGRSDDLKLSASDSDTLIEGLQALFNHSSGSERIRLLTLAPPSWGRKTIVDFFRCTQHQARAAIELRLTDGILAFPVS